MYYDHTLMYGFIQSGVSNVAITIDTYNITSYNARPINITNHNNQLGRLRQIEVVHFLFGNVDFGMTRCGIKNSDDLMD